MSEMQHESKSSQSGCKKQKGQAIGDEKVAKPQRPQKTKAPRHQRLQRVDPEGNDTGYPSDPEELRLFCENKELQINNLDESSKYMMYALQLIANLRLQDFISAKFLWKRIPKHIKNNPDIAAIWKIAQALRSKDGKQFYTCINTYNWPSKLAGSIAVLLTDGKMHFEETIEKTYSILSLELCAEMMGLTVEECSEKVQVKGWSVEGGMVKVTSREEPRHSVTNLEQLEQLASYVIHLEEVMPQIAKQDRSKADRGISGHRKYRKTQKRYSGH